MESLRKEVKSVPSLRHTQRTGAAARSMRIVFDAKKLEELNRLLSDHEKAHGAIVPSDGDGVTALCTNCGSWGCGRSGDCRDGYSK